MTPVELAVYWYGDLASGFYYELRRNRDVKEETCEQRGNSSVFRYREKQGGCSLVGFVDDPEAEHRLRAALYSYASRTTCDT